jgi:hypothetical protein
MAATVPHKFNLVQFQCPELIPDIENFLPVSIFKMATTILHKFNIVRFQCPELIPDIEKCLPVSIFKMAATIPQKFNIVRGHHNLPTYEMALKSDNVEFVRYCGGRFENGDQ